MYYNNVREWLDEKAIRVVRQGQRNYFVESDVAAGVNEPSLLPGQYLLRVSDFERLSIGGSATICLSASGLQKLYASVEGVVDINGGMPLSVLNSPSIVNTTLDYVPLWKYPSVGVSDRRLSGRKKRQRRQQHGPRD